MFNRTPGVRLSQTGQHMVRDNPAGSCGVHQLHFSLLAGTAGVSVHTQRAKCLCEAALVPGKRVTHTWPVPQIFPLLGHPEGSGSRNSWQDQLWLWRGMGDPGGLRAGSGHLSAGHLVKLLSFYPHVKHWHLCHN